jgi:hypothetical protein
MDKEILIFLHIPKTGGRTLQNIILRQFSEDEVITDAHGKLKEIGAWSEEQKHKIRYIQGHFIFGFHKVVPQKCVYITLLRDPVDRIISHYYFIKRSLSHPLNHVVEEQGISLEEYVTSGICEEVKNDQTRLIAGVERGALIDESKMLELAKENIDRRFLLVGLVECFDETLILLKRRLRLRNIFYDVRNKTINRPLKEQIHESTLQLIVENNQADIELYSYAKSKLAEMVEAEGESFRNDLKKFNILNRPYSNIFRLLRAIKRNFS